MRRAFLVAVVAGATLATLAARDLPAQQAQEPPRLAVTSPEEGAELAGPNVVVRFAVTGAELTSRRSGAGAHILLRLDDHPPVKSVTAEFTFQGVRPGNHALQAELRHADGSAYSPPIRARVRFTVRPGR